MKLLVLDMDGVLITGRNFWMKVHEAFGTLEEGKILTDAYLHTDYGKLVEEVVGRLWRGRGAGPYYEVVQQLQTVDGISEFFAYVKQQGYTTAIISGGSWDAAKRLQDKFGIDRIYANKLIIKDDVVTGDFDWPVANAQQNKADILGKLQAELGLQKEECAYLGDSRGDLEAFELVGLAIAFNTQDEELITAAHVHVNSTDLRDVIPVLQQRF